MISARHNPCMHRSRRWPAVQILCALSFVLIVGASCKKVHRIDTTPLDLVGTSYSTIQDLKALNISDAEIKELVKAKQAGISDATCVELVRIARSQQHPFNSAEAVAGLLQVGMSEESILQLARMKQIGLGVGELQAIRLAGLPDSIVLEVAHQHSDGHAVLSGASIAQFMNTGMSRQTLLELIRRGVPDDQAQTILAMKRHRAKDAEVLARYPAQVHPEPTPPSMNH
ncbi:MAG: hypothetical protein WBC04_04325 [Candidatus Acidiferrales bacterium]